MERKQKRSATDVAILIVLLLLAFMCLIPMLNTVAISFSDKVSAQGGKVFIWPVNFNLAPYRELIKDTQFFRSFMISVYRVLLGGAINVVLTILTAYPLSKSSQEFKGRMGFAWFFAITMLIGGGLIPAYLIVTWTRLRNTIWAMVLPGAVPVYNVVILLNFFKQLPKELEES
ncbi:MAG TPA: carbohydrate ABC transporter permease, partial [Clostridia bacterium]|nr:carbohydrate ABC transporter permease [Clostridia bacterium]